LAWALCATQKVGKLVPLSIMAIGEVFKKKSRRLTRDDMIELHQLIGYIELMVKANVWPKSLSQQIGSTAKDMTRTVYKKYDKCMAVEVRKEIIEMLDNKGIAYKDEEWIKDTWRADILFKNSAILLTGKWQQNEEGLIKGREHMKMLGLKNNLREVMLIDVDKWKTLEKRDKMFKIEEIIRKAFKSSMPKA